MEQDFTAGSLRRMSDTDYTVADGEPDVRGWTVVDAEGHELGEVDDLIVDTSARKVRFLELDDADSRDGSGRCYAEISSADIDAHNKRVVLRTGRSGLIRNQMLMGDTAARSSMGTREDTSRVTDDASYMSSSVADRDEVQRLTRAEEEVRVGKRSVQTGEVRVGKHVETEHRHDDVTVTREQVHIERRPVTDAHGVAEIRASEDEIRIPVVEEEVVVEKRPVVREELVISKERVEETRPVDVEVRREEFDIRDDRGSRTADEFRSRADELTGRSDETLADRPAKGRNR